MAELSEKAKKALEKARQKTETYQSDVIDWIDAGTSEDVDRIMSAFHKKEASLKEANQASYEAHLILKKELDLPD